jgi:uncharacterized protein YecT (DUF1311 family)
MRHLSLAACFLLVVPCQRVFALGTRLPSCGRPIECQKTAKAAFDAEMARVGKDCTNFGSQQADDSCQGEAEAATERNFRAFYSALEGIVGSSALQDSQQAWLDYRKKQCDAVFDFWRPGTIAPSAKVRCEIDLTRSRMRDLDSLFDTPLHH